MKRFLTWIVALTLGTAWAGPCTLENPGFEAAIDSWEINCSVNGGGATGAVTVVDQNLGGHAHSGNHAAQLMVQGAGITGQVAWASISQILPCIPGRRMQVGYYAHPSLRLDPETISRLHLELRVEYYRDLQGDMPIPTHATFRTPLDMTNPNPKSSWIPIVTSTRAPPSASCMKISVVLWALDPGPEPSVVWVDDLAMRINGSRVP